MSILEEKSRASPFLKGVEIRIVKGMTCLDCYYCNPERGCCKDEEKCLLKIDEIYKKYEIYDYQLKLDL